MWLFFVAWASSFLKALPIAFVFFSVPGFQFFAVFFALPDH